MKDFLAEKMLKLDTGDKNILRLFKCIDRRYFRFKHKISHDNYSIRNFNNIELAGEIM